MIVRVSKPEFNLRDKLSELDKPIGLKGSELMRSETAQEARNLIGIGAGRKNLFINGDMFIDQRAGGAAATAASTGFWTIDRWKAVVNPGSKFSMQRKSDGTVPGFPYYMRLTSLAATTLGSSEYQLFWQTIESQNLFDHTGFGFVGAKDLTLSFWVRSSVPGPFSGALENWGQNRACVWQVNIDNADTWEYKTVHIPAIEHGDWQVGSTNGAYFMFSLGSTLNGTPNIGWVNSQKLGSNDDVRRIGINGATVDLTGCQLEIGKVATEFEHHSYTEELALCQRYYYKLPIATNGPPAYQYHNNHKQSVIFFPTTMRGNPTCVATWGTAGTFTQYYISQSHFKAYIGSTYDDGNSYYLTSLTASSEI